MKQRRHSVWANKMENATLSRERYINGSYNEKQNEFREIEFFVSKN